MAVEEASGDRHIPFDAVHNFRDLGGYTTADGRNTRWKVLYRADGINRLSYDGGEADHERVRDLGIRTVVDLRTVGELEEWGRFPVDRTPVEYHHLPLLTATWERDELVDAAEPHEYLSARYYEIMTEGARGIAATLELLADPANLPLVFHCAAGKDRTGVMAAVILNLLGVPDDVVAHDYGLSREGMERWVRWLEVARPEAVERMADQPKAFLDAPPAAMVSLLELVRDEHGSMHGYVGEQGIGADTLDAVRSTLLD